MSKTIKVEDVVKKSNQPQNLKEGDLVTLVLNKGYYQSGGKLLKNDKISEKHHTDTFYSGREYYFVKRDGDKVLIQLTPNGYKSDTHSWVDISEIYKPFDEEFLNSQPNDYVEYEIKVPIKLKYSFNDWINRKRRKEIIKFKTPIDGKVYDRLSDIPKIKDVFGNDVSRKKMGFWDDSLDGYKIEEVDSPITIFEQLQWKEFKRNFDMVHCGDTSEIDFSELVKEEFNKTLKNWIDEKDDVIIKSKVYGYNKSEYVKGEQTIKN
jgi:hypothetical protein